MSQWDTLDLTDSRDASLVSRTPEAALSPGQRTLRAHPLTIEPQPEWERNAERDGQASEERVASSVPERVEHLATEQGEGETEHRPEDGGGGKGAGCESEGVDEVELDRQARRWRVLPQ